MEKKEEMEETTPQGENIVRWYDGKPYSVEFNIKVFEPGLRDSLRHCRALGKRVDSVYDDVYNIFHEIRNECYYLGNNQLGHDVLFPIHLPRDPLQRVYSHPDVPWEIKEFISSHEKALDRYYLATKEMLEVRKAITPAIQAMCDSPISYWYVKEHKVVVVFK